MHSGFEVFTRRGPGTLYRKLASGRFALTRDRAALWSFLTARSPASASTRCRLVYRFYDITNHVRAYHTQAEILEVAQSILRWSGRTPVVVEAGAAHGASTAKLSLAVAEAGGELHVFDSFRGLPPNEEVHENYDGRTIRFRKGAFAGRLNAVRRAVEARGAPGVCTFHRGWFDETLSGFDRETIQVALIDVDLWASTDACLKALVPRLDPSGTLYSQDGHLRTIAERLTDELYWREDVGVPPPQVTGVGTQKLIRIERSLPRAGEPLHREESPPSLRR